MNADHHLYCNEGRSCPECLAITRLVLRDVAMLLAAGAVVALAVWLACEVAT